MRLPVLQLHINGLNRMDLLCQASFNTVSVKCIHVVASVSSSFVFIAVQYSVIEIHHYLFIHSPVDGHLACFLLKCFE